MGSNIGSLVAKGVGTILDNLTPEGETERIIFRRFDGRALARAAENNTELAADDTETIVLKINPTEITYNEPKIIQKVQTSVPGRFVVFDWGTDLLALTIVGNTGNLLPATLQAQSNILAGTMADIAEKIKSTNSNSSASQTVGTAIQNAAGFVQNAFINTMTYTELLNLSPKYRIFENLRKLYQTFDADMDILTLELGETVYRGYFADFSFTQTAENPWNWKYNMTFVVIYNLSNAVRRGDDGFIQSDEIIAGVPSPQ